MIGDAIALIELLSGSIPSNARLKRIGDAFWEYKQIVQPAGETPTNEEKAENILRVFRWHGRRILRSQAIEGAESDALAAIQAAGDSAEGDL